MDETRSRGVERSRLISDLARMSAVARRKWKSKGQMLRTFVNKVIVSRSFYVLACTNIHAKVETRSRSSLGKQNLSGLVLLPIIAFLYSLSIRLNPTVHYLGAIFLPFSESNDQNSKKRVAKYSPKTRNVSKIPKINHRSKIHVHFVRTIDKNSKIGINHGERLNL